ncbi:MAG: TonB-dependent receptor [Pseudomonadota bacterium]
MKNRISIVALAVAISVAAQPTAAATITSSQPENASLFAVTLRDRPLNEFAAVAAVDHRPRSDFTDNYADEIADGLFFAPGVELNRLDVQEPRLSIRGFSLGNTGQRSGPLVLRDGAPLTDVHGETNTSEIDLLSTESIEIQRGVVSLRDGGGNLGGVIALKSRTGRTTPAGLAVGADAGASIDGKPAGQAHIRLAGANGATDYYLGVTGVYENGWRDNNRRSSQQFHGNVGFALRDSITTRFFLDFNNSETELAGPLSLADLEADPQSPTPPITLGPLFPGGPIIELVDGAREDDFARDIREGRIANETNLRLFAHDVMIGGHYTMRDVESPQIDFVGFLDESGSEWGARLAVERDTRIAGIAATYRVGGDYTTGEKDADRFENIEGEPGDPLSETRQKSTLWSAFAEVLLRPLERLAVEGGAKFVNVDRSVTDLEDNDLETRGDTGVAARAGVRFDLNEALQVYVGGSRAYEPPAIDELTAGDPTDFADLDAQDSFSIEAGVRGRLGDWAGFDIAYYNTDVENEILSTGEPNGFILDDVFTNAAKTTHEGVEAGLDLHLFPATFAARGGALTLRSVYNWSNHRFVDAGDLGSIDGNRIAGAPTHRYRGELRYVADARWFVAANVELARGDYFADHENETAVPTDPVIGVSAGYRLSDQIEVFASGENLTDQAYVAGVSSVLSADPADRLFTPGDRASVYGGVKVRF